MSAPAPFCASGAVRVSGDASQGVRSSLVHRLVGFERSRRVLLWSLSVQYSAAFFPLSFPSKKEIVVDQCYMDESRSAFSYTQD